MANPCILLLKSPSFLPTIPFPLLFLAPYMRLPVMVKYDWWQYRKIDRYQWLILYLFIRSISLLLYIAMIGAFKASEMLFDERCDA